MPLPSASVLFRLSVDREVPTLGRATYRTGFTDSSTNLIQKHPRRHPRNHVNLGTPGPVQVAHKINTEVYMCIHHLYSHNMNTYTGSPCKMYFLLQITVKKQKV